MSSGHCDWIREAAKSRHILESVSDDGTEESP